MNLESDYEYEPLLDPLNNSIQAINWCKVHELIGSIGGNLSANEGWCPYYYDSFLCWPPTPPNATVTFPCPVHIENIEYENRHGATRHCNSSGQWEPANYSGCFALEDPDLLIHLKVMYLIYWFGYVISLISLLLALTVFARYRKLWCLRNIIHCNLILCFALHNLTWIGYSLVAHEFLTNVYGFEEVAYCYIPTTILKYFIAAGFFWMFIEGAYLLMSVLYSFYAKRIQFWMCAIVGWVIPLLLIVVTTIAKANSDSTVECWNEQHHLDFIFIGPVLIILFINLCFLVMIMYVVVTKLQVTVPVEATRYKKAIKALFILCPLLGVNYIFVLVQPINPMWLRLIFSYYFTITTSLQGCLVAILFCFRNNEVWQTIKRSVRRWIRAMGIASGSQKRFKQSMRLDTQSSMMLEFEGQSTNGRQSRKNLAHEQMNNVKNNQMTPRRGGNVIVMRDDGELRLFLPSGRKITAPTKLRQQSMEQTPNNLKDKIRDRNSLPEVRRKHLEASKSLTRTVTNAINGDVQNQKSNYRSVAKGETAQMRRARYALCGDITTKF